LNREPLDLLGIIPLLDQPAYQAREQRHMLGDDHGEISLTWLQIFTVE